MGKVRSPLLSFNRGLVDEIVAARIDVDRIRLSATKQVNWCAKTSGAMLLRPGTQYLGSSKSDGPANWIEFVASISDTALIELTDSVARFWLNDALLARPSVSTSYSTTFATSTGFTDASTGGTITTPPTDQIPTMAAATTGTVTITALSQYDTTTHAAWRAGDNNVTTMWACANGSGSNAALASTNQWLKADLSAGKTIASYGIRGYYGAPTASPKNWKLQGSNDNSAWTDLDTQTNQVFASSELKTYTIGSPSSYRYYRVLISANNGHASVVGIAELELYLAGGAAPVQYGAQGLVVNATAKGSVARVKTSSPITVAANDQGVEHAFRIVVARGPVTFYAGSSDGDDDLISRASLGEGTHSLGFTPQGDNVYFSFENNKLIDKIVTSIAIEAAGTVELPTPWPAANIGDVRYDQSADVIYAACFGTQYRKIERRGVGRSWSVVKYQPDAPPFFTDRSDATVQMKVGATYGNTTLTANKPFFKPQHVGASFRIFSPHMNRSIPLGAENQYNGQIRVAGISAQSDRTFNYQIAGTWVGTVTMQRSYDGDDVGYFDSASSWTANVGPSNGTDGNDNAIVYYRFGFNPGNYTSGVAVVTLKHGGTSGYGIVRVTGYVSATQVNVEVVKECYDTAYTDSWRESIFSDYRGWPTDVKIHEGRLAWFGATRVTESVPDDYENFSEDVVGDAGPIVRKLGRGPVNRITFAASLKRLILGTAQEVMSIRSNSFDEPLTPTNTNVGDVDTKGAANIPFAKVDQRGVYVDRSTWRLMEAFYDSQSYDYKAAWVTKLCPDLLKDNGGAVWTAVQRSPDTRVHVGLGNGSVLVLTYQPEDEVVCPLLYQTDGVVERAAVLPVAGEDNVYYHVNRTINGVTKRYLEKFALESECIGGTLNKQADAFKVIAQGSSTTITGLSHLEGKSVVVWNGATTGGITGFCEKNADGTIKTFTVTAGQITGLSVATTSAIVGLPYTAQYQSTKLAYAAQQGTALTMPKKANALGIIARHMHHRGLRYGRDFSHLVGLPQSLDNKATAEHTIYASYDQQMFAFGGTWDTDERLCLQAQAPRPVWLMAAIVEVQTNG